MLKPYICVACDKVIIGKDDLASLISLFSKIIIVVPPGTEIPRDAVAPKEWSVFSSWDPEPGDEHLDYQICTQLHYPDGTQFGSAYKVKILLEPNKRAQVTVNILGFPIGQPGEHKIHTWLELNNERVFGPIELGIGLEIRHQETVQLPVNVS